eukprot:6207162-Pleurochrysis_carterae.AAC.4
MSPARQNHIESGELSLTRESTTARPGESTTRLGEIMHASTDHRSKTRIIEPLSTNATPRFQRRCEAACPNIAQASSFSRAR